MAGRPYGKRRIAAAPKAPTPAQLAEGEILIAIHGRHTLEQIAREMQIAVERMREAGAYGVEKFRIRFEPRDAQGQPMILRDEAGQLITKMQIPEPAKEPPYRPSPYDAPAPSPETARPAAIQPKLSATSAFKR